MKLKTMQQQKIRVFRTADKSTELETHVSLSIIIIRIVKALNPTTPTVSSGGTQVALSQTTLTGDCGHYRVNRKY